MTHCNINKIKLLVFFLTLFLHLASFNSAFGETLNLQKDVKKFGDWKVFCETDIMMDNSHCKIAAKFFDNSSVITIEPSAKSFNQFLILIPQAKNGSFVKIRVDKNDLILSDNIRMEDFGLIILDNFRKNNLFSQMNSGDFLFLRFNINNSEQEVTVKINLQDFRNAVSYYTKLSFGTYNN